MTDLGTPGGSSSERRLSFADFPAAGPVVPGVLALDEDWWEGEPLGDWFWGSGETATEEVTRGPVTFPAELPPPSTRARAGQARGSGRVLPGRHSPPPP